MVTATLREIIKVLGFYTSGKKAGSTNIALINSDGMVNPYDYVLYNMYLDDTQINYNYATSGEAKFGYLSNYSNYMHSPSTYNPALSMNYFKIDETNQETLLLQPQLKKEQSILKIGSKLREVLDYIGWQRRYELVGIGGDSYSGSTKGGTLYDPLGGTRKLVSPFNIEPELEPEYIWPSKKERELLEQKIKRNDDRKNSPTLRNVSYFGKKLVDPRYKYQYFGKDGVMAYQLVDGWDLIGWSFYLIKKDGTLDRVATSPGNGDEFPFNIRQILENIPNIDQYARTGDGYLRARINRNKYDRSPVWENNKSDYNWAQHIYIQWYPEKPTVSKKTNYLRTSNDPDSYYKEVEVSMANMGGITSATVTQKEYEGSRVYTSVYDVDPAAGYFTTTIDRELKTTLQLTVSNGRGYKSSEIITYAAENLYSIDIKKTDNNLSVQYLDRNNQPKEGVYTKNATITNIYNHSVSGTNYTKQRSMNNSIDISALPNGIYVINVIDNNDKTLSYKFIKK